MTTLRMIVDDCVDSLIVFSGFINRIADKLQQLADKSQRVYFFGHGVGYNCIRSVCSKNNDLPRSTAETCLDSRATVSGYERRDNM